MSAAKRICIVTQSHLCRNPRVLKEAISLAGAGYQVDIVSGSLGAGLHGQDQASLAGYTNIKLHLASDLAIPSLRSLADRALARIGRSLVKTIHWETPLALGYGISRYERMCQNLNADLYICHQELATHIGNKLIRKGYKVAFDLEDWYSEDLLPEARRERPVKLLREAEKFALHHAAFCLTTSDALAEILHGTYHGRKPEVIYNVFPKRDDLTHAPKAYDGRLRLLWFSQTIGPGRGLEQFIALSGQIKKTLELNLLGNVSPAYKKHLFASMPSQHVLRFHETVPEQALAAKIAGFDIGLALELDTPPSRDYTITNKFFQYIQAGLPVIASHTRGQNEGFNRYTPGFKLAQQPSKQDTAALLDWLDDPGLLLQAREKSILAADEYNWENESIKLLALVNKALEK